MLYSDSKTADNPNSKCSKQIEHVKTGVGSTNVYLWIYNIETFVKNYCFDIFLMLGESKMFV